MPVLRLLPFAADTGAANMARDEALLRSALDHGRPSLRFYTWSEPTLSLGYFQSHREPRPPVAWVRRQTGGAAILHHHELTYALALPAGREWHTEEHWICRFHHAVASAWHGFGVRARAVACGEERKLGPFLCFQHQTPGDLLVDGHKVAGSAQRRPHGALLQHGSLLLRRSPHAPELPGVLELAGCDRTAEEFAASILVELQAVTGWAVETGEWTDGERSHATLLERERYGHREWNEKR